jgi:release factor glutamine methyltransferase
MIPRPDTEHLVDIALEYVRRDGRPRASAEYKILDLCCGSGCIGLAIKANCPEAAVTYGDISEAALAVTRDNGGHDARLLDALSPPPDLGAFDILVCNPPYVVLGDPALDASVLDHEPHIALFGGADGLDFYRSLLPGWLTVLKPGGLFAVETGYDQAATVSRMARDAGLPDVNIRKDYAGHERIVYGYKRGGKHGQEEEQSALQDHRPPRLAGETKERSPANRPRTS